MKKILLIGLLLLSGFSLKAQVKAVTETGEEVLLYKDGTWKYLNGDVKSETEIQLNSEKFKKNKDATFLVKSNKTKVGVWLNPKEWSFSKSNENEPSEYQFQKKGSDLYAMLIAEQIEIPLETLKTVAFSNAQDVAPDVKITKEEYRIVNDLKVLYLEMRGTIKGMKFIYNGYYYSDESGTIQLLTYTSQNLFDTYQDNIFDFLNGFVEQ